MSVIGQSITAERYIKYRWGK